MSSQAPKSGCLKPLLIGVIGLTVISGLTFFLVFTRGLYRAPDPLEAALVIRNAQVFDGDSVLAGQPTVVVEDGRIACLGDCDTPPEARVIDASGQSLLPGLIDGYSRFYAPTQENLSQGDLAGLISFIKQRPDVRRHLLAAGVTTLFSAGDLPQNILLLKDQVETGDLAGPRVRCTGPDFTAPGGYPLATIYAGQDNLEEQATRALASAPKAQQEAAQLLSNGVDAIKIVYDDLNGQVAKLDQSVVQALIAVAEDKGRYAVVRCGTAADLRTAAELGARVLAYGPAEALDSATIAVMQAQDVVYYPLLARRLSAERPRVRANLKALLAAGVAVGVGADPRGEDQSFGRALHDELVAQVEAGRDPRSALRAATRLNARALRLDDQTGHLAEGLQADLILVQGRPWDDIEAIRQVRFVLKGGRVLVENGELVE